MIGYCTMRIKPSSVKNGDAALRQEAFRADNHFSNASKYSLQGTTQGNGLTGGACRPSDFPCDVQAVACSGYGGNHQIHHPPFVVKGYILPCVEVAGNLADLFRAGDFHRQLCYLIHKFLLAPVQFLYLHIHIGDRTLFAPVRLSTSFSISLSTWASSTCRAAIFGFAFAAFFLPVSVL